MVRDLFDAAAERATARPVPDPLSHPGLRPHAALLAALAHLPPAHWAARCTGLAEARGLRSAGGAPLRFVVGGGPREGALEYEAAIFHEGRVACRDSQPGAAHDLHNALCWLAYPLTKATLNRLHLVRAAEDAGTGPTPRRGPARDRLTLLDESGVAWLSNSPELDARLHAGDWQGLLVAGRERLRAEVDVVVIGHGLLQKLAAPYKALTAHCLVCGPREGEVDAVVARSLARAFADGAVPELAPLPVQGLPDWDRANRDPSYYDDPRVFRTRRRSAPEGATGALPPDLLRRPAGRAEDPSD
ncbi:MAG: DUF3025 domain-containing protein [Burkholderiaceae bacterium]|nr:DUF3025 domain-containing protein [Burkholderiaceae bacterium]